LEENFVLLTKPFDYQKKERRNENEFFGRAKKKLSSDMRIKVS
jgi:hypothetical protein